MIQCLLEDPSHFSSNIIIVIDSILLDAPSSHATNMIPWQLRSEPGFLQEIQKVRTALCYTYIHSHFLYLVHNIYRHVCTYCKRYNYAQGVQKKCYCCPVFYNCRYFGGNKWHSWTRERSRCR